VTTKRPNAWVSATVRRKRASIALLRVATISLLQADRRWLSRAFQSGLMVAKAMPPSPDRITRPTRAVTQATRTAARCARSAFAVS
jgi:hypothetical protein